MGDTSGAEWRTNRDNRPGGCDIGDPRRRLNHVFEGSCDRTPASVALECGPVRLSYRDLDERANRVAHHLIDRGIGVGARVAVLLHRCIDTYVAILAVAKSGAAFVPIDPESPVDRIAYITSDADVDLVVTSASFRESRTRLDRAWLEIDRESFDGYSRGRPLPIGDGPGVGADPACYVIYTSGSTGRPKGVEVAQSSICNFLDVVPGIYDVQPADRVYQGMTISFDFSIEEIWPTWARGATLVAGPTDSRRLGADLADFLDDAAITVLYCVPTLLATIPRDLPGLRTVLVGGEACPRELVERWSRPGRRILNTYGPTEATVTATWCELLPGRPVTIGRPLPSYSVVLLDERRTVVPDGEVGEICVGGPGVARGYVGRPELTAERFIDHLLAPPGGKLYRTGDLGRITAEGEVEYLGRADSEVKIRGHRIDLGEIESVILEDADVAVCVVAPVDAVDGDELASYLELRAGTARHVDEETVIARVRDELRVRLPRYMVPAFLDVLDALPTMPSGKVDRNRLPTPTGRRLLTAGPIVAVVGELEHQLRTVWAQVLGLEADRVSAEADFFTDLGRHSLTAARLISQLRESELHSSAGIRDLYEHPTIRSLAQSFTGAADSADIQVPDRPEVLRHTDARVARAGAVQAVFLLTVLLVVTAPVSIVYSRHHGQPSVRVLLELLLATIPTYLGVRWLLPMLLVRPLSWGIGAGRYPLWGSTYLRLWMIDHLLVLSPIPVLSGSAMLAPFLRVLGASIGSNTDIGTSAISLPSLIRIGDGVAVGYNADLRAWRVEHGWVVVAPVIIDDNAFVGSSCVLEPGARVETAAMLAEQSLVCAGHRIPEGTRWAGSPARPVARLTATVEQMMAAESPRPWTPALLVCSAAAVAALEVVAIATIVPALVLVWAVLLEYGMIAALLATLPSGTVYVLTVCGVVAAGKRVVLPTLPAGVFDAHSGLGIRKWIADKLFEMSLTYTNSLYATLYTAPWLRLLGAKIGRGAEVSTAAHIDPSLLRIGAESFVADMASVGGSTFANGRMAFDATEVGVRSFVGNAAFVPAGTRTGTGSLVGVLTVPPTGDVPEGTSWLGSPAMFLPTRQDSGDYAETQTFRPTRRLIGHRLLIEYFRITLPATVIGVSLYFYLLGLSQFARTTTLVATIVAAPFLAVGTAVGVVLYVSAVKRNVAGTYRPRVEPLWARFVRRSEFATGLYEAAAVPVLLNQLLGTPFLAPLLRGFGADIGKRTWIGTTYLAEFDLVRIGDDAAIGTEVSLQTHLFEDRVMKMSQVTVDDGATVGSRSIVLYDAIVGDDATVASLSLLMKGEQLPPDTHWRGIPAQAVH
ncbi:Pls/PosA family non-ribosomal peptide synthetase [Antrihabitans cavernicola]|uniref:Amino acid adenylation domain-containing protein n=1 Tax=Antrihabitans cavernicola TaxID=2495913 RepID=A0A5A7S160_9NOCA|nr:Pls/PosA family non-ribosomal peptide synthetase [Spelaeibacter cavernicola]KAA0017009.1 amino acid adenylation domain-containing protein [Spelaeibacter cavernicola]